MAKVITCRPKRLPQSVLKSAAAKIKAQPGSLTHVDSDGLKPAQNRGYLSIIKSKRWRGPNGVRLTVSFMDGPSLELRKKIVSHMNAWNKTANVQFTLTNETGVVRIARDNSEENGGYWSYLGTDILHIDENAPTLNLEGFTMKTSDAEFRRVVRHEAGHTLGFPHEHMRRELVDRIDRQKAIRWYEADQGWGPDEVDDQVLTPIEEKSILGTDRADSDSVMCYHVPGLITLDGKAIRGGKDIDAIDFDFAAACYPKPD